MAINNIFNNYTNDSSVHSFTSIIDFLVKRNKQLNISISISEEIKENLKYDNEFYFKSGQLLMFLYLFSISDLSRKNIHYSNRTFCIDLCKNNFKSSNIYLKEARNICNDIVRKSTYYTECFPQDFDVCNLEHEQNFKQFINGFIMCYNIILEEKLAIIDFLKSKNIYDNCYELIKNIMLLNPHDLSMQLQFIRLKYNMPLEKTSIIYQIETNKDNNEFINLSTNLLDILIENSIIGIYNNDLMEKTWIQSLNKKPIAVSSSLIYISIYFAYISNITKNKYYMQSAYHCLLAFLDSINENKAQILKDKTLQKATYILNSYIDYPIFDEFLKNNSNLFSSLSKSFIKNCNNNIESLIVQYVQNKSIDALKTLILC